MACTRCLLASFSRILTTEQLKRSVRHVWKEKTTWRDSRAKIFVNGQDYWITASNAQGLVDKALQVMQQPEPPMTKSTAPQFDQYALNWYKLYIEPNVKATTAGCVISYIRKQYVPFFCSKPLDRITVDDVQTFLNQRSKYAQSTLKDYRMWLAQFFDAAVDDGFLTKNPAKSKRIAIPSRKVTEREALSEADLIDILNNPSPIPT